MNEQLKKWMVGSGVCVLAIWTIGPFIAIAGQSPLANIMVRIALTLAFILAWGAVGGQHWLHQRKQLATKKLLQAGEAPPWLFRFKQQLQATKLNTQQSPNHPWGQCPQWTLVLGSYDSGKRSLLLAQNCQQVITPDESQETVPFEFWSSNKECFLVGDTERLDNLYGKYSLWQHTIPLIKKQCRFRALRRIVLVIDFPQLCRAGEEELTLISKQLQRHVNCLQQLAPTCSIQLIINKCDRIIGFKEYFSINKDFIKEETLGLSFQNKKKITHFDTLFHQQRNTFIQRISDGIISLIQKQHIQEKRKDISQLPFQLDLLLLQTKRLINPFSDGVRKQLISINFCAALQRQQPLNVMSPFLQTIISPLQSREVHAEDSPVGLFIGKQPFAPYAPTPPKSNMRHLYLNKQLIPVISTLILATALASLYHTGLKRGYSLTNTTLQKIQNLKTGTIPYSVPMNLSWLIELNENQAILHSIHSSGTLKYRWLGINTTNKLYRQVEQSYQLTLTSEFEPYAFSLLSNALLDPHPKTTSNLYSALKVYFMLTKHSHYNKEQIIAWYREQWHQEKYSTQLINLLTQQLTNFLAHYHTYWPASPQIVAAARDTLNKLPTSEFIFLKLEAQALPTRAAIIDTAHNLTGLNPNSLKIPTFFTTQNYQRITTQTQQSLLKVLTEKDWVVPNKNSKLSEKEKATLVNDVLTHYKKSYHEAWENLFNNLEFKTPKTLSQLNDMIQILQDPHSNLYELLNIILINTSPKQIQAHLQPKPEPQAQTQNPAQSNSVPNDSPDSSFISIGRSYRLEGHWLLTQDPDHFQIKNKKSPTKTQTHKTQTHKEQPKKTQAHKRLYDFLKKDSTDSPWQDALHTLQKTAQPILQMKDANQAAFAYVAQTLDNTKKEPTTLTLLNKQTSSAPTVVQKGLKAITQSYWPVMLNLSRDYLNTQWQQNVMPLYLNSIKNKFPVYATAHHDTTVADFNAFFGPKGAIDDFFNTYLVSFINMSGHYWTWKKIDNNTIGIPQSTLDMLIRASIIQQIFYSHGAQNPTQQFGITLRKLSDNVSSLTLNIEGQTIQLKPGETGIHAFTTPGKEPSASSLTFNGSRGKETLHTKGPWAWLHLAHLSDIKTTSDANQFFLTFTTTYYTAKFGLVAQSKINPYLPSVLNAFRFPEKL